MNWKCLHIWSSLYKPVVRIMTTIGLDLFEVGKKSNEFQIHEELLIKNALVRLKIYQKTFKCRNEINWVKTLIGTGQQKGREESTRQYGVARSPPGRASLPVWL